mgnify:CR=1 FL=1
MYKLALNFPDVILKQNNGVWDTVIPKDPANTDYQAYLKWLEEGNTPQEAE